MSTDNNTIFGKILRREIPADIVYEDDQCLAFNDVAAQAPYHILLIPKKLIPTLADAEKCDAELLGHMMLVVGKITRKLGIAETFRLVINNGAGAQQSVFHMHMHILSGRKFTWPPG